MNQVIKHYKRVVLERIPDEAEIRLGSGARAFFCALTRTEKALVLEAHRRGMVQKLGHPIRLLTVSDRVIQDLSS